MKYPAYVVKRKHEKGEVVCCPEKGGGKRWGIYDTLVKCEDLEKKYRELEVLAEKLAERIRCHNLPFHNGCANPNDYSTILEYESWKKGAGKWK